MIPRVLALWLPAAAVLSLLTACDVLRPVPPDQYCKEAGYAIASRTFECTGDDALANARYERFTEAYSCIEYDLERTNVQGAAEKDLFHCGLAIGAMTCEEVADCGDDIGCYLTRSPTCALVVAGAPADEDEDDTGGAR